MTIQEKHAELLAKLKTASAKIAERTALEGDGHLGESWAAIGTVVDVLIEAFEPGDDEYIPEPVVIDPQVASDPPVVVETANNAPLTVTEAPIDSQPVENHPEGQSSEVQ